MLTSRRKKFFPGLVEYAASGPVYCMVWEGDNVVLTGRKLLGATRPFDSNPGTIRGNLCIDVGRNICHGSDSVESAEKEIALWFKPEELNAWNSHANSWVYEVEPDEAAKKGATGGFIVPFANHKEVPVVPKAAPPKKRRCQGS